MKLLQNKKRDTTWGHRVYTLTGSGRCYTVFGQVFFELLTKLMTCFML